jgi:hypothetical protein
MTVHRSVFVFDRVQKGWHAENASLTSWAIHPFDDAEVPSRSLEKQIRKLSRIFAQACRHNPDELDCADQAFDTLSQYVDLAELSGDVEYAAIWNAVLRRSPLCEPDEVSETYVESTESDQNGSGRDDELREAAETPQYKDDRNHQSVSHQFCTECGDAVEPEWKYCAGCGTSISNRSAEIFTAEDADDDKSTPAEGWDGFEEDVKAGFVPGIDRRIAYLCSLRWALLAGAVVWVIVALFLPINASYSAQSKNGVGVIATTERLVACPNGFEALFSGSAARTLTAAEGKACAETSPSTWLVDGAIIAILWGLGALGLGYLINRNRYVRNESVWFPYGRSM